MSDSPLSTIVSHVEGLILRTFLVSKEEARERASGLVEVAEGKGGLEAARSLNWSYRVKKDLGDKFKWRSEAEREEFACDRQSSVDAYEEYIRQNKRA